MRLIRPRSMREVNYFGESLEIPSYHNYVATDEFGYAHSFSSQPDYQATAGVWVSDGDGDPSEVSVVALFDLGDTPPQATLRQYPVITRSVI